MFCSSEKKLYIAALSPHAPTLPIDPSMPCRVMAFYIFFERN